MFKYTFYVERIRKIMKKRIITFLFVVLIVTLLSLFVGAQDYLALQGSVSGAATGNVTVEIYDAASSGNLIYNSTKDFWGQVNNSRYDILLGNSSNPLSLKYGTHYYMNIIINEKDMNFNDSDRQVFQSPVGNISMTSPILTSSTLTPALSVNGFNVSGADANLETNGTITIESADTDDSLNITTGGMFVAGNTNINNNFNITASNGNLKTGGTVFISGADVDDALNVSQGVVLSSASPNGEYVTVDTNGRVLIRSVDADDALNVSGGIAVATAAGKNLTVGTNGFSITDLGVLLTQNNITAGGSVVIKSTDTQALTVNNGFNVSGRNSDLKTNGTITILSTSTPALTINNGFNVSGATSNLQTNGTVTILSLFNSALAINGFNVSGSNADLETNGTVTILSTSTPALSIHGFNVSGANANVETNGTIIITEGSNGFTARDDVSVSFGNSNPPDIGMRWDSVNNHLEFIDPSGGVLKKITFADFFNITASVSQLTTNGTMRIENGDMDDALNVTNGFTAAGFAVNDGAFVVDNTGKLYVKNNDVDDALNITNGALAVNDKIIIGSSASTKQNNIQIFSGGADKCGAIVMYDELRTGYYLFINTTGDLRISTTPPSTCDTEGEGVGGQPA